MNTTMSRPSCRYATSPVCRWARWGGSKVPPRIPIRTRLRIGNNPQRLTRRPAPAGQERGGVDVLSVVPQREVDCRLAMSECRAADDASGADAVSGFHRYLVEIRHGHLR